MDTIQPNKSRSFIFIITAVMICLTAVSGFFLFKQVQHHDRQIAGEVIEVTQNKIIISNRNNKKITLLITADTKIRNSAETLEPGMFIHSFGTWIATSTFSGSRVRVVKK